MNFILNERLQWSSMQPKGEAFGFDGTACLHERADDFV